MSTEKSKVKTQKSKLLPPATFAGAPTMEVVPPADVAPLTPTPVFPDSDKLTVALPVTDDLDDTLRTVFARAREFAKQAVSRAAQARLYMIAAGLELYNIRESRPEFRGRQNQNRPTVDGFRTWDEAVEQAAGISRQTANRWINHALDAVAALGFTVYTKQAFNPPPELVERLPQFAAEYVLTEAAKKRAAVTKRAPAKPAKRDTPSKADRIGRVEAAVQAYQALSSPERNSFVARLNYDLLPRAIARKRKEAAAKQKAARQKGGAK
jgi:hypothetical protein